jgi:Pyruvate/2-oxoacid:ferredoxin oxidoreductase delta subunit
MEEMIRPYTNFAVGMCQCRMAMILVDKGCGRPLENCVVMGSGAEKFIAGGLMRRTDAAEVLAIKRHAEENGCVSWSMSGIGGEPRGNSSCSCCGCCCHAMRSISQFNFPAMISPPTFMPLLDPAKCVKCGACIAACPMKAWSSDGSSSLLFDAERCIGCGLCVVACKKGAMTLRESGRGLEKAPGWFGFFLDNVPGYLLNAFRVWARRHLV